MLYFAFRDSYKYFKHTTGNSTILQALDINYVYFIAYTRYTHAHHVPHAEHVESSIGRNGEARSTVEMMPCCLSTNGAYPVHGSANEVHSSGADAQVVSCHRYLVFHPFVEQLTVFLTPGLVLVSSSTLRVLDLDIHRDGIVSGTCQRGT